MMLLWNRVVCSISPLKKSTYLETLIQQRSVRGHCEEDIPKKWMWNPSIRGWKLMGGSEAGLMLTLKKNLSYLGLKKIYIRNWFLIWWKVYTTIKDIYGFFHLASISFSWFWYPPVTLGNHPFLFLSPIMIMIELTSPPIPGVGMWLRPELSEHFFPPAVVIPSNQWHFGSCRGGRLARDRGGAGARRQISGNQMLDPALPEERNYLYIL